MFEQITRMKKDLASYENKLNKIKEETIIYNTRLEQYKDDKERIIKTVTDLGININDLDSVIDSKMLEINNAFKDIEDLLNGNYTSNTISSETQEFNFNWI